LPPADKLVRGRVHRTDVQAPRAAEAVGGEHFPLDAPFGRFARAGPDAVAALGARVVVYPDAIEADPLRDPGQKPERADKLTERAVYDQTEQECDDDRDQDRQALKLVIEEVKRV